MQRTPRTVTRPVYHDLFFANEAFQFHFHFSPPCNALFLPDHCHHAATNFDKETISVDCRYVYNTDAYSIYDENVRFSSLLFSSGLYV